VQLCIRGSDVHDCSAACWPPESLCSRWPRYLPAFAGCPALVLPPSSPHNTVVAAAVAAVRSIGGSSSRRRNTHAARAIPSQLLLRRSRTSANAGRGLRRRRPRFPLSEARPPTTWECPCWAPPLPQSTCPRCIKSVGRRLSPRHLVRPPITAFLSANCSFDFLPRDTARML
jgi:hypothetical protein